MTFAPKLYFAPGAVSMATHIALEEAGMPYRLEPISIKEGEQRSQRYLQVHPLGRLPALEIEPGVVVTETPALLSYLAALTPELALPREGTLERLRADEWLSLLASTLHVTFISFHRPDRYTADEAARAALKLDGKQRFLDLLLYVEGRLPERGFVLGKRYSLVDAYLTVFFLWARRAQFDVSKLHNYARLAAAVLERPAVRRALEQEGFASIFS
jgi:glutathione S-transferase